jgi:hypothetical protein
LDVLDDYYNYNNDTYYVPSSSNAVAFKTVMKVLRFEIELYKYVEGKWTYTKSYTGSGIYKLKATVRDFVTFEKLSINNIHFGFNQSNYYYLMGKNSSVNGDVMFKFDASKYDIKDGNVTFWIWSPDIPSLGSVPIPASSTQGSAQSQTGNAPKLGHSTVTKESERYYYISLTDKVKAPYIRLEVEESKAFHVSIRVKLFDTADKPLPDKKMKIMIMLFPGTPENIIIFDTSEGLFYASKKYIYRKDIENARTDSNGEINISGAINVSPLMVFGTLYVHVSFDDYYREPGVIIPPGKIYVSLTMLVSKKVTVLTGVDQILDIYNKRFTNSTEKMEQLDGVNVTTYMYDAILGKTKFIIRKDRFIETIEKYMEINFKMKLGPRDKRTGIEETKFNFIMGSNNQSGKHASFGRIYNDELINYIIKHVFRSPDYKALMKYAAENFLFRTAFKKAWQLSYPEWDFGQVIKVYRKIILTSKEWPRGILKAGYVYSYAWAKWVNYQGISDRNIAKYLSGYLRAVIDKDPIFTPDILYSKILSSGDYSDIRYILVAILASISTIVDSLGLALNETKQLTKIYLEEKRGEEEYMYKIMLEIIFTVTSVIVSAIIKIPQWAQFINDYAWNFINDVIYNHVILSSLENKYSYLRANTYSPLKLQRLVEIINYDLSLLNYEINIWDQLKD